jgi:hypothetical protein
MTKYFEGCRTIEELKKVYKKLAMENHPDRGGRLEIMQEINAQYDKLFQILKDKHNAAPENKEHQTTEAPHEYRDIIGKIIHCDGLKIEICGSWVWVSGNTYSHKAVLRASGFQWAAKKSMWYWHTADYVRKSRRTMTMDYIRAKYGSEEIETETQAKLA